MFPNVLLGPVERTLWLSCGLGCDWGWRGVIKLRATTATKPVARCHSASSQNWTAYRLPEPSPAHLSDRYTEAQRREATSSKPHSKCKAGPGETQGSRDTSARPTSQIPSHGGGRRSDECSLEGTLNVPFTRPWSENPQPLQRGKTQVNLYIFCSL